MLAGRPNPDSGRRFYLTAVPEKAVSLALRPMNARKPGLPSTRELDFEAVKSGWRVKVFEAFDEEWLPAAGEQCLGEIWRGAGRNC